jgi:hypothetical protein
MLTADVGGLVAAPSKSLHRNVAIFHLLILHLLDVIKAETGSGVLWPQTIDNNGPSFGVTTCERGSMDQRYTNLSTSRFRSLIVRIRSVLQYHPNGVYTIR